MTPKRAEYSPIIGHGYELSTTHTFCTIIGHAVFKLCAIYSLVPNGSLRYSTDYKVGMPSKTCKFGVII